MPVSPGRFQPNGCLRPSGGRVRNMLKEPVCATYISRFLAQNVLKRVIFGRFSIKMGQFGRIRQMIVKEGSLLKKFVIDMGTIATFDN